MGHSSRYVLFFFTIRVSFLNIVSNLSSAFFFFILSYLSYPFILGATAFIKYKVYGPEEAAHYTFASGGGFAWNMERLPNATYQDASVKNYFAAASRLPPSDAYHASGVGSPDVSALGQGYLVIQHGRVIPCGGTSAATPMFAGLISRLNEERQREWLQWDF